MSVTGYSGVVPSFTFIHVLGESVQDPSCGRRVEEFHGAAEDLVEELIVQLGGGSQSSLHADNGQRSNSGDT